jgi:hypothetical protein
VTSAGSLARRDAHHLDVEPRARKRALETRIRSSRPDREDAMRPQGQVARAHSALAIEPLVLGVGERDWTVVDIEHDHVERTWRALDCLEDVPHDDIDTGIVERVVVESSEVHAIPANQCGHELRNRNFGIVRNAVEHGPQREAQPEPSDEHGLRIDRALDRSARASSEWCIRLEISTLPSTRTIQSSS